MPPKASTSSSPGGKKISLPAFLKLLTSGGVGLTTQDAMTCASALVRAGYNKDVKNPFAGVSEVSLVAAGVTDPDVRKTLVAYGRTGKGRTIVTEAGGNYRKRKTKDSDLDAPLRDKAPEKEVMSLNFEEETEDYLLKDRSLQINRAPVMTAWATVVAERLGFTRQEALSIAHTYTNMNATAKGVSLGIYSPETGVQKTEVGPSQPYVELMGRKIPVLSLQTGEWRGIANGAIAEPEQAFGYIFRSFRQHMSAGMGALKLLAGSFETNKLNEIGYQLYIEFRPDVKGWGEKGRLDLGKVLELRWTPKVDASEADTAVKAEATATQHTPGRTAVDLAASDQPVERKPTQAELPETQTRNHDDQGDALERPSAKKVKVEEAQQSLEDDYADDGGISDSDLLGLV